MQNYYDWPTLMMPAAASAAVLLVVQYTKSLIDRAIGKIPTRLFVLALSLLIVLGAQAFTDGVRWQDVPLVLLNGIMVAAAAMGEYEVLFAKRDKTKRAEPPDVPDNPA